MAFKHTDETKQKLSKIRKGKANPFYGKKHSDETLEKMRKRAKEMNYSSRRTYEIQPVTLNTDVSQTDLAYLSGLIDGEGSIALKKDQPEISVYNCDERVMKWLVDHFGGNYRVAHSGGREPNYSWIIGGARNIWWLLKAIAPYLIIKDKQAKAVTDRLFEKYGEKING